MREQLGLGDERLQAQRERRRIGVGAQLDLLAVAAARQVPRQELLHRDIAVQPMITRKIDDAEATCCQHPDEFHLAESGSGWQGRSVHRFSSNALAVRRVSNRRNRRRVSRRKELV